ncbi:MAG: alpha/beta family hydrolase [Smithella sp.]
MDSIRLTIPVSKDESVSGILTMSANKKKIYGTGIITAHGAGNDMENDLLAAFADGMAKAGYPVLRFNFPYKEKGLKVPDKPVKLEDTWTAACRYFKEDSPIKVKHLIAAGKSMGGRIASQMAAAGRLPVECLIFLGYPLHPARDRSKVRDAHLYHVEMPMLFFAGTRDTLCDLTILQSVLNKLSAPWELEIIEGGDHSFHVPKSMGIPESDIYHRIVTRTTRWLETNFS